MLAQGFLPEDARMETVEPVLRGGCLCGAVRYEAGGRFWHETNCHCSICRRSSGAPFVAWFTVAAARLRFTAGEPACFQSSEHGRRGFCARCGTQLSFRSSLKPQQVDITTCSLDQPEQLPPRDHTQASARLAWVRLDDGLPVFAETRSG
jgi:hypothetical protein